MSPTTEATDETAPIDDVERIDYSDLVERKRYIDDRLEVISVPDVTKKRPKPSNSSGNHAENPSSPGEGGGPVANEGEVPVSVKTDTHWDFVMKEMMWLGADFQAERKRQMSSAKKCAASVKQYHKTKEARRLRELAQAEAKRRKMAARIGREMKSWWNKMDKVIAFKQKVQADEERKKAMNKQLVVLVQQTEKYTESLAVYTIGDTTTDDDSESDGHSAIEHDSEMDAQSTGDESVGSASTRTRRRKKSRKRYHLTIEEALASENRRKSKSRVVDYALMKLEANAFYGESTASDASGSDESFSAPDDSAESDDDSTLRAAIEEELHGRNRQASKDEVARTAFLADPEELRRLHEEQTMDIEEVLKRLESEPIGGEMEQGPRESAAPTSKRVKFRESVMDAPAPFQSPKADPGEDADDDADASDVENYNEAEHSDEDYEAGELEEDDETTIAQEENLPKEMSYDEEIDLLRLSADMPIEELRKMYAEMQSNGEGESSDESIENMLEDGSEDTADEEEYEEAEPELDDETTIAREESLPQDASYSEELDLLKQGAEMPIEELRQMYSNLANGSDDDRINEYNVNSSSDENDDEEFELAAVPDVDDETTIAAEEKLERDMSYEEELSLLQRENEMSVEELRAMYSGMEQEILPLTAKIATGPDDSKEEAPNVAMRSRPISERAKGARKRDESPELRNVKMKCEPGGMDVESDDGAAALNALETSAEKARQTLASRPFLLAPWVKLRLYQQVGLNWLVSLQTRRLNGILADEMGLGKTLQTIALLGYLASYKGIWGPHLVVVPTSVIINWETELKRFCPGLKVLCYYGSAKRRKELRTGWTRSNWYHVVITSYQLAVQDAFAFKRKKWYYLILDEAQNIKNFQSQRWQTLINFNTQRRLLLTGTPLQNSLMELWSLLHFLMPYIFKSRKEFSYWFSNPMNNIIEGTPNRNDDVINRLHGIIRPFVLRRLKKDVETQMPGKFEHIVKCQLSRRQMTLYEEFLSRSSTRQALKKGGNFLGMMNVLMQLRKVCNHPDLFEPRSVVTPFVLSSIHLRIPQTIRLLQHDNGSAMDCVSANLVQPLWSGSRGQPSFGAAMRHNVIEANGLRRLKGRREYIPSVPNDFENRCPEEIRTLLAEIYSARRQAQKNQVLFQNNLNDRRCSAPPFKYSSGLLDVCDVETSVFHRAGPAEIRSKRTVETPSTLLYLKKSEMERAVDLEETFEKFIFCVPSAEAYPITVDGGREASFRKKDVESMLVEPVKELLKPYRKAHARLSSFFPDKKLVQYDSGKLQTLAQLLRTLKQGGHRALIFTQMSKMLDILEAFLNIHGYTYLRLDGATGVDRRQRYMDRFNNDAKIFCFILSTRSGGMGINLTGADTVIFYDSDWNPAMDAQAQDRAHRIGQTRDVHIYRLITEHTIEENILSKAKQKRNLDIMVMDRGKFDASSANSSEEANTTKNDGIKDMYTKRGLQAILGVADDDGKEKDSDNGGDSKGLSKEQMEKAMAALEDEDDVNALLGAQKEAADELKEFDENAEIQKSSDNEEQETGEMPKNVVKESSNGRNRGSRTSIPDETRSGNEEVGEKDLENEFASWQLSDGFDEAAIEKSLSPMERYGLRFHEEIDPFYSIFFINDERRRIEVAEGAEQIDIEVLEREKASEELQAMEDGDLLSTRTQPEDLIRQRNLYRREKARLRSDKKRRQLKGENWSQRVDGLTQQLFWYNEDTGEAVWETPRVVAKLKEHDLASKEGWSKLPMKPLVHLMSYLVPFPERQKCSIVCRQWKLGANDIRFVKHVYPVEMGALAREANRRDYNHYLSVADALVEALPGDTIELSDGHYYVSEPGLLVDKPLKLVGDENNPANVVIEMSGSIRWSGQGGWIEGITFRRPKIASGSVSSAPMLDLCESGRINMIQNVFDNEPNKGTTILLSGTGQKGNFNNVITRNGWSGGIRMNGPIQLKLTDCTVKGNLSDGVIVGSESALDMTKCKVSRNRGHGIRCAKGSKVAIVKCHFAANAKGVLHRESGCNLSCSGNTATVFTLPGKQIPGFKLSLQKKNGEISTPAGIS